jgi:hypothetical protein
MVERGWLVTQSPGRSPDVPYPSVGSGYSRTTTVHVMHQTVIVMIGFYVVQWDLPTLVKYLVISFTAVVATLGLYDVGVRRTAVTRVLFGMKRASRQGVRART